MAGAGERGGDEVREVGSQQGGCLPRAGGSFELKTNGINMKSTYSPCTLRREFLGKEFFLFFIT